MNVKPDPKIALSGRAPNVPIHDPWPKEFGLFLGPGEGRCCGGSRFVDPFAKDHEMDGAALRLKMSVQSVKSGCDYSGNKSYEEVMLSAVTSGQGDVNKKWSQWTPSGQLAMTINNPDAFGKLLPGQYVFVDLTITTKDAG